ncbi:MAG TPA: TIR domain-containing protein [Cytophagaceae bacterium]|jgi:hypothetical protein|nr:TIR domain-containing protein [Cytophagaceae bacterium]
MPELKTYDLFISHAWSYNDDYNRLEGMLKEVPYFKWRNYSLTEDNAPVDDTEHNRTQLKELLNNQIKPVNIVLILGGMYAAYSEWIMEEIKIAQQFRKPIIGIYPWGHEKMPLVIQESAAELVGWNSSSIIGAIRKYAI